MEELAELFLPARTLVGFASNRYDVPVLNLYFRKLKDREALNLWAKERVDILEEIERQTGERISLNQLAEANLGVKKEGHGSEAIALYERGELEALKKYCLQDVELTKRIYDIYLRDRSLLIPDRVTGEMRRLEFGAGRLS